MKSRVAAACLALLASSTGVRADRDNRLPAVPAASGGVERHHYTLSAKVRPLLVFWITRDDVGDAFVTRQRTPAETTYSLLIGSDPERAPRRINRWGYIEEAIRGGEAHLVGLMTESDEDSIEQAEAGLRKQAAGDHPFKVIRATVDGAQARSTVISVGASRDYTFRDLRTVLDLAEREGPGVMAGKSRVVRLPPGARPGFLAALADAMHDDDRPIPYVYHGRIYELRRTHAHSITNLRIGHVAYGRAIAADFLVTSAYNGEQTRFSMTYGVEGRFAEVPITASYQPRWWMQVELTLDGER
jgi:hypothetical protein